jgi:hypothetical protein
MLLLRVQRSHRQQHGVHAAEIAALDIGATLVRDLNGGESRQSPRLFVPIDQQAVSGEECADSLPRARATAGRGSLKMSQPASRSPAKADGRPDRDRPRALRAATLPGERIGRRGSRSAASACPRPADRRAAVQ